MTWREVTYHAVSCVYAGEVDLVDELDSGWLVGVLVAAVHFEGVDSVFVDALHENHISTCFLS